MSATLIPADERASILEIQDALYYASLSFNPLACVNIVERRRFQLRSDIEEAAIWMTPRNGRSGMGIIWEMPMIDVRDESAPGPQEILVVRARVIAAPEVNRAPTTGTLIEPELACKYLRRLVHNWYLRDRGEFLSRREAMRPLENDEGLLAYEESWAIRMDESWYSRLPMPVLTTVDNTAVLTPDVSVADQEVWYTLDDSPPTRVVDENSQPVPNSKRYTTPIPIPAGSSVVLRWGAYKDGYLISGWDRATLTAT